MRHYNSEEYKEKMIQVYGESVVNDFKEFKHGKNSMFPATYDDFKERMEHYVSRTGCIDKGIKEVKKSKSKKKVSNYYTNKRFARFILISIEKCYGKTTINLAEKKEKDKNVYLWETEHIIPQKNEKDFDPDYIRCLGNLTLISGKLNSDKDYKNAEYKAKKKIILEKGKFKIERDFYLNKFFEEKEIFNVATVDERYKQLKREFKNIFIDTTNAEFTLSRFEEIIGVREMDNRE